MIDQLLINPLVWSSPVAVPVVVAVLVAFARTRPMGERLAAWAACPAVVLAMLPGTTRTLQIPWLVTGATFVVDETTQAFLLFTGVLWLTSGVFGQGYLRDNTHRHVYLIYFLLAMSGNMALILAGDVVTFYVGFTLMTFAAYGLIVFNNDAAAHRAGNVYMVMALVGEVFLLAGLAMAVAATGSLEWRHLGDRLVGLPHRDTIMLCLFFGLAIKAGTIPLHVWLPLAHPAAPTPASAVLSGAMIKGGLLGWLQLLPLESGVVLTAWGRGMLVLGLIGTFYGVAVGLTQRHPKVVLAYSSVSQIGLLVIAVGLAFLQTAPPEQSRALVLAYAMHHGLAKGALFLAVAIAAAPTSVPWQRWLCRLGTVWAVLALAGAPLTSGAVAKAVMKINAAAAPAPWLALLAIALPLASIGTTLLLARFLWILGHTPPGDHPLPRGAYLAWGALLIAVFITVVVWPWGHPHIHIKDLLSPTKVVAALLPVLFGSTLAAAVTLADAWGLRLRRPSIPAGDILEPILALGVFCKQWGAARLQRLPAWPLLRPTIADRLTAKWEDFQTRMQRAEILWRRGAVFGIMLFVLLSLFLVSLLSHGGW